MNRVFAWPVGSGPQVSKWQSVLHAAGGVAGGVTLGVFLSATVVVSSWLPTAIRFGVFATIAYLAVLLELTGRLGPFPQRRAQVPRRWIADFPSLWYAPAFGWMLGFGVLTWIRHAIAYCLLAALIISGRVELAFLAGVLFGTIRGLTPLVHRLTVRREETARRLELFFWGPRYALGSRVVLAFAGLMLLVQMMTDGTYVY